MTLNDPDSPVRRMSIAIGAALAIMVAAGVIYVFVVAKEPSARFNGAAIVAAARAYSHDLQARRQPIPQSVSLDELVLLHFLKPEQVEVFRGSQATIMLTSDDHSSHAVLMRVRSPDGTEMVLFADGTAQELTH